MLGPSGVVLLAAIALAAPAAPPAKNTFVVTSKDVHPSKAIAMEQVCNCFGCSGSNLSPELSWKGAPAATRSYAITMYDPDAPTGSGWWHWLVYNLPATTTSLPKGAGDASKNLLPEGAAQGNTDFGTPGYGGPCPPPGTPHRYIITVFALDTDKLDIPANATAANIGFNLHMHQLAKATLTGKYLRSK